MSYVLSVVLIQYVLLIRIYFLVYTYVYSYICAW
jgi:hypothetical protein